MRRIPLHKLSPPYRTYYQYGRWDLYARSFEEHGMLWLLEGRSSQADLHLQPLLALRSQIPWTKRLAFLQHALEEGQSEERLEQDHHIFSRDEDHPATAVVIFRAVTAIWRSGSRLRRMQIWDDRARLLVQESCLLPIFTASLFTCRALTALLTRVDLETALAMAGASEMVLASSKVQTCSIVLLNVVVRGMVFCLQGRFQELDVLLKQTRSTDGHACDDAFLHGYLDLLRGLRGLAEDGQSLVSKAARSESGLASASLSASVRDCCHNLGFPGPLEHCRLAGSSDDSTAPADPAQFEVDAARPHVCFILHAFLSAYFSRLGHSAKGLAHAEAALVRGVISQSSLADAFASLPKAQCLIDLGRASEAKQLLKARVTAWKASGMGYLAGCGALELAGLYSSYGQRDRARSYFDQVQEFGVNQNGYALIGRPAGFVANLRGRLFPSVQQLEAWMDAASAPIRVVTLGNFILYVHGKRVFDRTWRNSKSKMLLKALIVHGGVRVARESLLDLLWPEAEGDQAASNLKMTTSRLRKIVDGTSGERLQWLMVAEGRFSLIKGLCFVDALRFSEALRARLAEKDGGVKDLARILEMYDGDFLPQDVGISWIDGFRSRLRSEFLQGVVSLAQQCLNTGQVDTALEHLLRVERLSVSSEQAYALTMQAYLQLGYPAEALRVFENARDHLERNFCVKPGPALTALARRAGS